MLAHLGNAFGKLLSTALAAGVVVAGVFLAGEMADEAALSPPASALVREPVYAVVPLGDGASFVALERNGVVCRGLGGELRPLQRLDFGRAIRAACPVRLAASPTDESLFVGCLDGTLFVCRLESFDDRQVATVPAERHDGCGRPGDSGFCCSILGRLPGIMRSIDVSADGELVCATDGVGSVGVWNARTGRCVARSCGSQWRAEFAAFCGDGRQILIGDRSGLLTLWDPQRPAVVRTVSPGARFAARTIASSTSAPLAAWGSHAGRTTLVQLWNIETGVCVWTTEFPQGDWLPAEMLRTAFSRDGRHLACGCADHLALFDAATGLLIAKAECDNHQITSLAFTRDGRSLLSGGGDGTIRGWDAATLAPLWRAESVSDTMSSWSSVKKGTGPIFGTAHRVLRTKWTCPLFQPGIHYPTDSMSSSFSPSASATASR